MVLPPVVQPVALHALGYRKLGPRPGEPPDRAQQLAIVAANPRYDFNVQPQGNERFIRRTARRAGGATERLLRRVDDFDAARWTARQKTLAVLQQHQGTGFYATHMGQPRASAADCMHLVTEILDQQLGTHVRVVRFQQGIAFASGVDLDNVLRGAIDLFFQWQAGGRVRVYSVSESLERYHGYLRAGYAMENVAPAQLPALRGVGFDSLRKWHPLASIDASRMTLAQLDHLFYPYVTGFMAGPLGLLFHFVLEQPVRHDPGPWPPDWPSIPGSLASFGAEAIDHGAVLGGNQQAAAQATHRRFLFAQVPALADRLDLEDWWAERANALEYELLDPTAFVDAATDCIDFRDAFEHALTVDRVRRSTLAANTFPYPSATKGDVFAIADLYETLCRVHRPQRPARLPALPANQTQNWFKQLFHPAWARALIDHCLATMPAGIRAPILQARDVAYAQLTNSILNGVFVPGARQPGGGVSVAGIGGALPAVETDDAFVANVIRALRNTHHGYLTSQDPRAEAVSRYLAITNGNVTDDISLLPAIWWLACLGDPHAFCGITMQPVGQYAV